MKSTSIKDSFVLLVALPRTLLLWALTAASLLLVFSCEPDEIKTTFPGAEGSLVCIPRVTDMATKSQISTPEDKLSEASVAAYDATGNFVKSVHSTDMSGIELPLLHVGETYHIYAAFNMGNITFPAKESDITSLTHTWNVSGMNTKGLPMVWSGTVNMTSASQNVSMQAVRLVSKIRFSCDDSGLDDHNGSFTVSSVALKNATGTVSVFSDAQSLKGQADYSSDSATASDISSLNAGGKVSFYTFENLCGTLLPGNTDPWKKVPDNISGNAAKCTYLEVAGTYATDGGTASAPVTYRMYLGENATTNFDLMRNYVYDVTLRPSDEGIDRTSWKITRGSFSDSRSLVFTPASVTMNLNGSATFRVIPTPSDMKYTVAGGEGFASSTLTLAATGNANEYSLVSSGSLSADVYTSLVATSWDGRVRETFLITVKAKKIKSIAITPATVYKKAGETQAYTVTATYDEGGTDTQEDVTAQATYTSSDTDVAVMGTGANRHIATAKNGGTSTITASFGGKTATAQFNTRYPVALKAHCDGYMEYNGGTSYTYIQRGDDSAPTWTIDWDGREDAYPDPENPPTVPYIITAVYSDGTESAVYGSSTIVSLCTATQTYEGGNAGEGKCFVFSNGKITQAASGDKDTGGNGTVTFSYTEAGRTATVTVTWWKRYVTHVELMHLSNDLHISDHRIVYSSPVVHNMTSGNLYALPYYNTGGHDMFLNKDLDKKGYTPFTTITSSNPEIISVEGSDCHLKVNRVHRPGEEDVVLKGVESQEYRGAIIEHKIRAYPNYYLSNSSTAAPTGSYLNTGPGQKFYLWRLDENGYSHSPDEGWIFAERENPDDPFYANKWRSGVSADEVDAYLKSQITVGAGSEDFYLVGTPEWGYDDGFEWTGKMTYDGVFQRYRMTVIR